MAAQKKKKLEFSTLAFPLVAFDVTTANETIKIIRIADHFAWRWDNKRDGKSYGSFVIQPPFKEKKIEKQIKELGEKIEISKGGRKEKLTAEMKELLKFYDDLKTEDISNLLSVLIEQADVTIDKINGVK